MAKHSFICVCAASGQTAEPTRRPGPPRCAETEAEQVFLVRPPPVREGGEEKGKPPAVRVQEGAEADRGPPGSSFPLERNGQAAHRLTNRSGCRNVLPVPDTTEQYCDSQLPIERED